MEIVMKRFISIISAAVLLLTLFSGCTGSESVVEESYYDVSGDVIKGDTVTETNSNVGTTVDKGQKSDTVGSVEYSYDITKIAMPERELSDKTITYYSWIEMDTDSDETNVLMQKEFGVKFEPVLGQHANYWDTLATLVGSGKSPDLVMMPNWNFYPTPIVNNLIQPLDGILDLEGQLWEDTYAFNQDLKWKGKTYIVLNDVVQDSWLFYNTKMFKNYGVDKTPKDYFLEDNWTWDTLKELADQFVSLNSDGSNKTAGLCMQNSNLHVTTGVEMCTTNGDSYSLNLKDQKITTLMNFIYTMGMSGTKSLINANDPIAAYANGEVAMIITKEYALTGVEWEKVRDSTEWVPMPKMDADSDYYLEYALNPSPAIASGAKNAEGAALYIEFNHWKHLGWQPSTFLEQRTNAAIQKYKISSQDITDQLTDEEIEWTKTIYDKYTYKYVTNFWASWTNAVDGTFVYPGMTDVINGKAWSAVLQEVYPKLDAGISSFYK